MFLGQDDKMIKHTYVKNFFFSQECLFETNL